MSELKGTNIAAAIKPFTTLDKYATHDEEYGRGGYRSVNSISEMNAIPSDRRKEGMLVKIISSNSYYTLKNGIFQLEIFGSGSGSSSSNIEFINLIDISENPVTNVTPSSSLVDEFYNISRAFTNNKSAVANWFNDVQGIFPISIADIYSDIIVFSVFYYDRIVKVRYDSNTNKYSTELLFSDLESASAPNLDMDVRIQRLPLGSFAVYFKIKEKHENGYIQFSRLKKQRYIISSTGVKKHVTKYAVYDMYYGHIPGISTENIQANVWYEYPMINNSTLISKYTKGSGFHNGTVANFNTVRLTGNINANPCIYTSTSSSASPNKVTAVSHIGLQYNIVNPNYANQIRENGKMPLPFLYRGELKKIRARLMAKTWNVEPKLFLNLE